MFLFKLWMDQYPKIFSSVVMLITSHWIYANVKGTLLLKNKHMEWNSYLLSDYSMSTGSVEYYTSVHKQ